MLKIKVHESVDETNLNGFKQMFQKFMGGVGNGAYTNGNWKISTGAYDLWFEIYLNGTPVIGCVDGKCKWYKNPMEVGLSKADAPKIETIITSEYPEISFVGKNESICESFNPKTVKIGNQTWMAENLAIDDGGEGIIKKNGETYYTWRAANRISENTPGWHLPSNKEWFTLIDDAGGTFYAGSNLKKSPFNARSNQDFWSSTSGSSATYFHFSVGNDVQTRQSVTSAGSFTTGRTEIPCLVRLIKD